MPRLVVVGAGVSGLAAAWAARADAAKAGVPLEIVVLERDGTIGGKARTVRRDGFLVETGPTSYLDDSLALDALIADAGLAPHKLAASAPAAHRFLVMGGRLRELGPGPLQFFTSGILSPGAILRLLCEPLVPRGGREDETLLEWGSRRSCPPPPRSPPSTRWRPATARSCAG